MRRRLTGVLAAIGLLGGSLAPVGVAHAATPAGDVLDELLVQAEATSPVYDRDDFEHWSDADGDRCDTRSEVLIRESEVPVTYSNGCTVATGRWASVFDGLVWTQASDVDIDHLVPLQEAWQSGASGWTPAQREAFANDLDYPGALVVMTDHLNQSKGSADPADWLPPAETCDYLTDWTLTKWRWNLAIDSEEAQVLDSEFVTGCNNPALVLPARANVPAPTAPTPPFSDVLASHPFAGSIIWLASSGVTGGYGDGTFRPNTPVTRGQFAAFLYRYSNPGETPAQCTRAWFSDIPTSSPFCGYITWLAGTGITAGYADGTFRGSAPISRAEMAAMLQRYRAAEAPVGTRCDPTRFTDVRVAYCGSITWLANTGITGGYGDGSFRPNRAVNRGQFAAFLDRYDQRFEPSDPPIVVPPPPAPKPTPMPTPPKPAPTPKPPTKPTPTKPANPGDSKNCSDFSTWSQAQAWFNKYYPHYGDVARLDANNDRIACESLPGAP